MTDINLKHEKLVFDPDLDLESIAELPGKDVMTAVVEQFARRKIICSKLIQDSHGWCFYVQGDDARRYLLELIYITTANRASEWALACDQLSGFRFWEWLKSRGKTLGLEQRYLDAASGILVSELGFVKASAG